MKNNITPINPNYYKAITLDGKEIEVFEIIDAFNLNHYRACMVKYILRADKKGEPIINLLKCYKYLNRELKRLGLDVSYLEFALKQHDTSKPLTDTPDITKSIKTDN